jgi:CHAT domain-containing protein
MPIRWLRAALAASACCLGMGLGTRALAQQPAALSGRQIIELAGQGRYDELAQGLAAREQLSTGEQHALCHALSRIKHYRQLMACLDKLQLTLKGRDRASLLFGLDDATATVNLMRAEALLDLGQWADAEAQAQRALDWYEKEGGAAERDLQAEALGLLALAAVRLAEPEQARAYLKQVQAIPAGLTAGPNVAQQRTLALARGHLALGEYAQACTALESDKLFDFRRSVELLLHGNPPNWVWQQLPRLFMLARCRQGQGRSAEAKAGYDELLALPALRQNQGIHWLVLHERGAIANAEGDREGAIRLWREAIAVIELMRSAVDTEAAKIGFVADKQAVYGSLLAALLAAQRVDEALEVAERAKSRVLVDLLADRHAGPVAKFLPTSHALAHKDPRLAALLERHREADEALLEQPPLRSDAQAQQQRNKLAAVTTSLREAAPSLASLVAVAPAKAAELAAQLEPGELGVEYYQHGERLYALVFGAGATRAFALDGAGLVAEIREFRAAIVGRKPNTLALARKLHTRLIEPLAAVLGNRALLIVPHGGLHYLPFAALHDGKSFLLEQHALRVTASTSALQYLHPEPGGSRSPALILGDPLRNLPSAEAEARRLGRLLSGSRVLIGNEATRKALLAGAPRAHTLHIASHALFDTDKPLESMLILAPEGSDDGEFHIGDIYGLDLAADLVTLSACETGLGRITDGGEVIGMIRGFLYAGATSVVASLWPVPDEETALLMENFYTNLARMNKRDALRAAQLTLTRRTAQPFFWAAFYLSGSAK